MLQKFKNVFLLVLILGMGYMLWLDKKQIEILKNIKKSFGPAKPYDKNSENYKMGMKYLENFLLFLV